MKNYSEAENYFTKALDIYKITLPQEHPEFGKFYQNFGMLYCMMGNYPTALEYLNHACKILEAVLPPDHPDLVKARRNISIVHKQMSSYGQTPWHF